MDAVGVAAFAARVVSLDDPPVTTAEAHALEYSVAGVANRAQVPVSVIPGSSPCTARPYRGRGATGSPLSGNDDGFVVEAAAGGEVLGVFFRCWELRDVGFLSVPFEVIDFLHHDHLSGSKMQTI